MNTRILAVPLLALLGAGVALAQDAPVTEALPDESAVAAAVAPAATAPAPAEPAASQPAPAASPADQAAGPAATVLTENTLLIERVQEEHNGAMPTRGLTMAQVEAKYGAPTEKLEPRGGQKRQWPTIHRWTYPTFVVYFEKSKVIDAVALKADATEVGPKPPIR